MTGSKRHTVEQLSLFCPAVHGDVLWQLLGGLHPSFIRTADVIDHVLDPQDRVPRPALNTKVNWFLSLQASLTVRGKRDVHL